MYARSLLIGAVLFTSFLFGCSGSASLSSKAQTYKKELGHCRREQVAEIVQKVLFIRYQYLDAHNTRDLSTSIEIYTEWKSRKPFPDERTLGIVAVESRITISAKLSSGITRDLNAGEADFLATLRAENRVAYQLSQNWQPGPMTKEARAYFGNIAGDFIQEFTDPF